MEGVLGSCFLAVGYFLIRKTLSFLLHFSDGNCGMRTEVKELAGGHPAVSVRPRTQTQGVCYPLPLLSFHIKLLHKFLSKPGHARFVSGLRLLCMPSRHTMYACIPMKHGQHEVRNQLLAFFLRTIHLGFFLLLILSQA